MIKVEDASVYGFEAAVHGMRLPMNSGYKSDSIWNYDEHKIEIGQRDIELMRKLYQAGTEHRKYLRQIFVSMDITAPLYWWKEADTYKVGTVVNSCSTMHKLTAKPFELSDFSTDKLGVESIAVLQNTIDKLNVYRKDYLDSKQKFFWWQMIQLLPESYNQRRTVTMNYENVFTIIKQRTGHKLDEWIEFVEILKGLPYVAKIGGFDEESS